MQLLHGGNIIAVLLRTGGEGIAQKTPKLKEPASSGYRHPLVFTKQEIV
jgi:hypothetical protein